jgi:catechol 2,3-dioxygenase-like lactoylglutathione lyase family enzyme
MIFDRYSFVAITTRDLGCARRFWVDQLGFSVTEEKPGHFFIVDVGGLRLCVDLADGEVHLPGGTDPVIGLKVASVEKTLSILSDRGLQSENGAVLGERGTYAVLRDPEGRAVIITEVD